MKIRGNGVLAVLAIVGMILTINGLAEPAHAQLAAASRPFAIDASSGLQRIVGAFDSEAGEALIGMYVVNNDGAAHTNVQVTMSAPEGSGIVMTSPIATIANLSPGVPTLVQFAADFAGVAPDKYDMELTFESDQAAAIHETQRIFTASITVNLSDPDFGGRATFAGAIPEGVATLDIESFQGGVNWRSRWAPTRETQVIEYTTAFEGQIGPVPWADWLWKVVGALTKITVVVCGAHAVQQGSSDGDGWMVAGGAAAIIGTCAEVATWADDADPFIRGQQNTFPGPGELTFKEKVTMDVVYLDEPTTGDDFRALTTWTYTRFTVDSADVERTYEYSINDEMVTNTHWGGQHTLETDRDLYAPGETIVFTATIEANDGQPLVADQAYCAVIVQANPDRGHPVILSDDGQGLDEIPGDGVYTGSLLIPPGGPPGQWGMMLFAQENLFGFNEYGGMVLNSFPEGGAAWETFRHGSFIVVQEGVPTLTEWGMIIMFLVMAAGIVWFVFRQRRNWVTA